MIEAMILAETWPYRTFRLKKHKPQASLHRVSQSTTPLPGRKGTGMPPIIAREIARALESIAPIKSGNPNDQLGFIYGDPDREVHGVACVWVAHSPAIRAAIAKGCDMLIVHEGLFSRKQESPWYDSPETEQLAMNRNRKELLDGHEIVVYRSHSNWDALAVDGVPDQAVSALGISGLKAIAERKYFKVHEAPSPMTIVELGERAKTGLKLPWIRLFGDTKRQIRRFAFLIGGFGGNQHNMPQAVAEMGAEAIIIGEMSEFIVIAAMECGLSIVETLHSASEEPALKRQAEMLQKTLPGIPFHFIPSGALYF